MAQSTLARLLGRLPRQIRAYLGLKDRLVVRVDAVCLSEDGSVKWKETAYNALTDEGEQAVLSVFFQGGTHPVSSAFYVALYNTPVTDSSTLSSLSAAEPSTGGYARKSVNKDSTDWTLALSGSDYAVTSKAVTFTASGGSFTFTHACLASTSNNTGKLLDYAAFSAARTLNSGESLTLRYKISLA